MAVVTILRGAASGIIASAVESVIELMVDLTEWDDVRWFPLSPPTPQATYLPSLTTGPQGLHQQHRGRHVEQHDAKLRRGHLL